MEAAAISAAVPLLTQWKNHRNSCSFCRRVTCTCTRSSFEADTCTSPTPTCSFRSFTPAAGMSALRVRITGPWSASDAVDARPSSSGAMLLFMMSCLRSPVRSLDDGHVATDALHVRRVDDDLQGLGQHLGLGGDAIQIHLAVLAGDGELGGLGDGVAIQAGAHRTRQAAVAVGAAVVPAGAALAAVEGEYAAGEVQHHGAERHRGKKTSHVVRPLGSRFLRSRSGCGAATRPPR